MQEWAISFVQDLVDNIPTVTRGVSKMVMEHGNACHVRITSVVVPRKVNNVFENDNFVSYWYIYISEIINIFLYQNERRNCLSIYIYIYHFYFLSSVFYFYSQIKPIALVVSNFSILFRLFEFGLLYWTN